MKANLERTIFVTKTENQRIHEINILKNKQKKKSTKIDPCELKWFHSK